MRRYLIDHARQHQTLVPLPREEALAAFGPSEDRANEAIVIDELLERLQAEDSDLSSVVELNFFLGLSDEEAAQAAALPLQISSVAGGLPANGCLNKWRSGNAKEHSRRRRPLHDDTRGSASAASGPEGDISATSVLRRRKSYSNRC
jgi:hypothetical protein